MKIIRDGKEIELTCDERRAAYLEWKHSLDCEDVECALEQYPDAIEFANEEEEEQFYNEVIAYVEDFLSSDEHYWEHYWDAFYVAIKDIDNERRKEKKQ